MKVSVIIPCYNVADFIGECLESILAQDHEDLEVICVDDGSKDDTSARIEAIAKASPRGGIIRLIRQTNAGATAARNHGFRESSGAYIQFMDADDILLPRKIGHQVRLAMKNGAPDLIVGSFRIIDANGRVMQERYYTRKGDLWIHLMRTDLGNTISNLWKRTIVEAVGGWDEGMRSSQEYDLMFRILRITRNILFDTENYTIVRKRATGSITQTNLGGNWIRYVELRTRIIDHLKDQRSPAELEQFHQFLFDSIRVLYEHDPKAALEFHAKELPKGFRPSVSPTTRSTYLALYNLLGFRNTQRLWSQFHWLTP
ncbi:MAG: glycosyltransferase family 2 protein [Flavobacteriales bacterium]|nr:glycosyltransferase family 2 protein [Flavobacteriales bacterium]MCB9178612.1 glycosyltransferase family 2 protein [Flavobacteriales bacterium]